LQEAIRFRTATQISKDGATTKVYKYNKYRIGDVKSTSWILCISDCQEVLYSSKNVIIWDVYEYAITSQCVGRYDNYHLSLAMYSSKFTVQRVLKGIGSSGDW